MWIKGNCYHENTYYEMFFQVFLKKGEGKFTWQNMRYLRAMIPTKSRRGTQLKISVSPKTKIVTDLLTNWYPNILWLQKIWKIIIAYFDSSEKLFEWILSCEMGDFVLFSGGGVQNQFLENEGHYRYENWYIDLSFKNEKKYIS